MFSYKKFKNQLINIKYLYTIIMSFELFNIIYIIHRLKDI